MDLRGLLPRHHVLLHLTGESRQEVFRTLIGPLVKDQLVRDPEVFIQDLQRREAEITTQVEGGIAFPHARSGVVTRMALAVGIADPPGLFLSEEAQEPCRLFFLIGIPVFAPTAHLPMLQRLASFAHDPKKIARLLASKTPAQAIRHLATFKG